MRILLTCKKRGWNGETAMTRELAHGYVAAGHEVILGARRDSQVRRRVDQTAHPLNLGLVHHPAALTTLAHDLALLRSTMRDVDLVHTSASWDTWLVALARRSMNAPPCMVRSRHNLKDIRDTRANRWLFGGPIDCFVAVSRTVADHLRSHPFLKGRVATIYNGIDLERWDPARFDRAQIRRDLRNYLKVEPEAPVVAYVSRVTERKQPEVFLEAAALLRDRFPSACFVLAGHFPRQTAWQEDLWRRVEQAGPQVRALRLIRDVPRLLMACDVFVLPAPSEPFGLAPVEAMAVGCPPVCAGAAGLAESVVDGETGLLFRPGDAEDCARALARLFEEEDLHRRLAEAGRPHVLKHFTTERMVEEHLSLYRELCT